MKKLSIHQDHQVKVKFDSYPEDIREKLNHLRNLILETATEAQISELEETLKWGEPSYLVKKGSTIRIDWKEKTPDQYAMYFICSTNLVANFKMIYGDLFQYEKNRAILFDLHQDIPEKELKECIEMSLNYHALKDKPLLGK